jgi:hypothetical protein
MLHFGGICCRKIEWITNREILEPGGILGEQSQGEIPTCRLPVKFVQVGEKLKAKRDIYL